MKLQFVQFTHTYEFKGKVARIALIIFALIYGKQ